MKSYRLKLLFLSIIGVLMVILSTNVYADKSKKSERPIPKVYPYSYPYDEPHCPSGKCSRANENPKQVKSKDRFGRDVDED